MSEAVKIKDRDGILYVGETMLILMQQHNMKEEGILYPMADQQLNSYRLGLADGHRPVVLAMRFAMLCLPITLVLGSISLVQY